MPASKAKTKPRPARLVAAKRTAAVSKPVAAINSTDSLLLRLAPELRNRIYELVLGGKTLHFYSHRKAVRICSHSNDSASFNDYLADHKECAVGAKYCTSLLRVCRRINEEAALIPFISSTFAVFIPLYLTNKSSNLIWSLIDILLPAQRRAMTNLQLVADWWFKLDATKVKQLSGLRHLKLTTTCTPAGQVDTGRGAQIEKLGNGRLKSVKVLCLPRSRSTVLPDFVPGWTEQLEKTLLDGTSYTERKKKAMVELEKARESSRDAREARKAEQDREKEEAMKARAANRELRGLRALR